MHFKYNTIGEVIKHLEEYRNETVAKITAWQQVEIKKKKNGEEFARLGQALENARVGSYYPVENQFHPYLTVVYYNGYKTNTDHIPIFYYVDELSPEDCAKRQVNSCASFVRQTTQYTVEETRAAIEKYIKSLKDHRANLEKQIEVAPILFERYRKALMQAEKELKAADMELREKDIYPTSLYYAITSTK